MAAETSTQSTEPAQDRESRERRLPGAWRAEVAVRIAALEDRLNAIRSGHHPPDASAAEKALKEARLAIEIKLRPGGAMRDWWTGTTVTRAWGSVHRAEAALVDVDDDDAVRAALPHLLAWIRDVMKDSDQRQRYERRLVELIDGKRLDRTLVRQAYNDVIRANGDKHANLRRFRNGLWAATSALVAILVALAVWHAIDPGVVSLCGEGPPVSQAAEDAAADPQDLCLTGPKPRPSDVATVQLVGAIGGLLMIAFGLGGLKAPPSRYDPHLAQAALKAAAGAATGLIGVLLVQSDALIAPANRSESLLLAYAAIFGFSQQLFTRFVDQRSGKLLGSEDASKKAVPED